MDWLWLVGARKLCFMSASLTPVQHVIADSIDYLVAHYDDAPRLSDLAARAGYEATYFQKLFKENVGVSPLQLVRYMHMRKARELLGRGARTLDAAYEAGLSGNGRLHDVCVMCAGLTPGNIASRGRGLEIVYGVYPSILGGLIVAKTARGVCFLGFLMEQSAEHCIQRIRSNWPHAVFSHDDAAIAVEAQQIIDIWNGAGGEEKLALDLYGTNFQLQVWQALLRIPAGETVTYQSLAAYTGRPKASRAIGNAVGANPVSLLIPCHRVIRGTGIIDNYGWGSPRKKLILGLEKLS